MQGTIHNKLARYLPTMLLGAQLVACSGPVSNPVQEGDSTTIEIFTSANQTSAAATPPTITSISLRDAELQLSYLNFAFAEMHRHPGENLVTAPYDSALLLVKLALGANAATLDAISAAGPGTHDQINNFEADWSFSLTLATLDDISHEGYFWGQSGYAFNGEYLQSMASLFSPQMSAQDFLQNASSAIFAIDSNLEMQTSASIYHRTRVILGQRSRSSLGWSTQMSATAFNGRFGAGHNQVKVDMLRLQGTVLSRQGTQYSAVAIPLHDSALGLMIISPEADTLGSIEQAMNHDWWNELLTTMTLEERTVSIPLFNIQQQFNGDDWADLGVATQPDNAAGQGADFSVINNAGFLYLDEPSQAISMGLTAGGLSLDTRSMAVLQATEDEPDTLFGGVFIGLPSGDSSSGLVITIGPSPSFTQPCFDPPDQGPFLFAIYHTDSGLPLYLGRVTSLEGPSVPPDWFSTGSCEQPIIEIYRPRESLQCDDASGIPLLTMQTLLQDNGIPVLDAREDFDDLSRIQLCGSPDGRINVFSIHERYWPQAAALGFHSTASVAF